VSELLLLAVPLVDGSLVAVLVVASVVDGSLVGTSVVGGSPLVVVAELVADIVVSEVDVVSGRAPSSPHAADPQSANIIHTRDPFLRIENIPVAYRVRVSRDRQRSPNARRAVTIPTVSRAARRIERATYMCSTQ
jgi:hypothetical protein